MNSLKELDDILASPYAIQEYIKDNLKNKELILYGAGSMGKMALLLMNAAGIKPSLFVDQKAKGRIDGLEIISLSSLSAAQKKNSILIICVVTEPLESIVNYLLKNECENLLHFYDFSEIFLSHFMGNGWHRPMLQVDEIQVIKRTVLSLSHDEKSVFGYLRYLWWRLKRIDMYYKEYPPSANKKYFQEPSFPSLGKSEVFVDAGAHHGEISIEFIKIVNNQYSSIYAFEPDSNNYEKLCKQESLSDARVKKYKLALHQESTNQRFIDGMGYASKIDPAFGNTSVQSVTLDSMENICPTIIKLHLEGGEYSALLGAKTCIEKCRPIIMVVADHNQDGIFNIPEYLMKLKDYKLHFSYSDYCGNTSIFYAYPAERMFKE